MSEDLLTRRKPSLMEPIENPKSFVQATEEPGEDNYSINAAEQNPTESALIEEEVDQDE